MSRNGNDNSHINGHSTMASSASGQQTTNKRHQQTMTSSDLTAASPSSPTKSDHTTFVRPGGSSHARGLDEIQAPESYRRPILIDRHHAHGLESGAANDLPARIAVEVALIALGGALRVGKP
jgi:hypothetical protein